MPDTFLIITSIAPSTNKVLQTFACECPQNNVHFIVIGDSKSPVGFSLSNCDFYSLDQQRRLSFNLAGSLPECKYSRKNLGYLLAMKQGANIIVETDDDNFPTAEFWEERSANQKSHILSNKGWVNIYRYYTTENIWPRGFALEHLRDESAGLDNKTEYLHCPIQQGLCDENPDVDGVYRLVLPLPVTFQRAGNIALGNGSWCPFNSQNTTWFKEAFPLMYLPTRCNFRMTDIWRSFIAQRIAWVNGWNILFSNATVYQQRNEHNLLKDFEDEIPGYLNNRMICEKLMRLELQAGTAHIFENMVKCYETFIENGLIDQGELALLDDWVNDFNTIHFNHQ
jgi:hypothetical protein